MNSVAFPVLLCVASLATALVGAWVFDFHSSDAAGQGLAKGFTVVADIVLLIVTGILFLSCGARGRFPGASAILTFVLFAAGAVAQFWILIVLTELHRGDRYELPLQVLVPIGAAMLILYAALSFYTQVSRPVMIAGFAVAAISFALLKPAMADSKMRSDAQQAEWQRSRDQDAALSAEIAGLPATVTIAELLRYTDTLPARADDARQALVNRIKTHPERQSQIAAVMNDQDGRILPLLERVDVTVTPELCGAARKALLKTAERFQPTAALPTFSSVEDQLNAVTASLRWLIQGGCDCKAEIAALEKNVRLYPDPYPKKFFVDYLLDLQGKARE